MEPHSSLGHHLSHRNRIRNNSQITEHLVLKFSHALAYADAKPTCARAHYPTTLHLPSPTFHNAAMASPSTGFERLLDRSMRVQRNHITLQDLVVTYPTLDRNVYPRHQLLQRVWMPLTGKEIEKNWDVLVKAGESWEKVLTGIFDAQRPVYLPGEYAAVRIGSRELHIPDEAIRDAALREKANSALPCAKGWNDICINRRRGIGGS